MTVTSDTDDCGLLDTPVFPGGSAVTVVGVFPWKVGTGTVVTVGLGRLGEVSVLLPEPVDGF